MSIGTEDRFGNASATIGAIADLLWGRSEGCAQIDNAEAVQIGRALVSSIRAIDETFADVLHLPGVIGLVHELDQTRNSEG